MFKLKSIPEDVQQIDDNAASLVVKQAGEEFEGFLRVAPVTTESGIKKTLELQTTQENIERAVSFGNHSEIINNINKFTALVEDFNGLILKYDEQGTNDEINASIATFFITSLPYFILRNSQSHR